MQVKLKRYLPIFFLFILALAVPISFSTSAYLATSNLSSQGSISTSANLAVYSDVACSMPIVSIDWGSLSVGQSVNQTVFVKNIGSGLSLVLSLSTVNWVPENASSFIVISWNQEGTVLLPGEVVEATLTLSVSPLICDVSFFSLDLVVYGVAKS